MTTLHLLAFYIASDGRGERALSWPWLVACSSLLSCHALALEQLRKHTYTITQPSIPAQPYPTTPQIALHVPPWAWDAHQWTFPPSGGWMGEETNSGLWAACWLWVGTSLWPWRILVLWEGGPRGLSKAQVPLSGIVTVSPVHS